MGPAAGPTACWTSLFFPNWERLNHPAHYGSSSWTNGLLDKRVLPNWGANGHPAHYGSSSWTNGLLDKLVLPSWERLSFPARYGSSWTSWPAGQV